MATVKMKPGRVSNFNASMAEAMDRAFRQEWQAVKGTAISSLGEQDRRILMVAIAQGVIAHLQTQAEAIQIDVDVSVNATSHTGRGDGTAVDIEVDGLMGELT